MGFPGGGYEEQDASIRKTAERECLEEMGIDLVESATFLGGLRRLSHPKNYGGCVCISSARTCEDHCQRRGCRCFLDFYS